MIPRGAPGDLFQHHFGATVHAMKARKGKKDAKIPGLDLSHATLPGGTGFQPV
jgi:hypothetical protein